MELGCSTLLYGGHSLADALSHIAGLGYRAIELAAIPGMGDHLTDDTCESPSLLLDVKNRIAASGLVIESIGASTNLLDADCRSRFIRLMRAGQYLGAPAITSGSGGAADDEVSFQAVAATLSSLAPIAAETGVKVSVKPHVGSAVYSTATALRMMKLVDTEHIGLNVDASHLWRTPEQEIPEQTVPSLLPYLATARIRDTLGRERPIGPVENQIPGKGAMNLRAIIAVFAQKPELKYVVLEIVGTKGFSLEQVDDVARRSLQALAPMVAAA